MNCCWPKKTGFTLVELLIVMGMLGVVVTAVYSLYTTHQRSTYVQDEVVEIQQNLRIGLDSMTRDIRMAGLLVPLGMSPVSVAEDGTGAAQILPPPDNINSDRITVRTASSSGTYARVVEDRTGLGKFKVDSPEAVDAFSDNDIVTIIRPASRQYPGGSGNTFRVHARERTVRSILLVLNSGVNTGADYMRGDLIARTPATAPAPNTITYCLGPAPNCGSGVSCPTQLCLVRIDNGTASAIAANLAGFQLSYFFDNDPTEHAAPTAAELNKIRAVKVILIGCTQSTNAISSGQLKRRQMESIIQIRNR